MDRIDQFYRWIDFDASSGEVDIIIKESFDSRNTHVADAQLLVYLSLHDGISTENAHVSSLYLLVCLSLYEGNS